METRQFGKYKLLESLGHGGMGEVWKALDTQLQRYVAVKFLRANLQTNPDFITHFMREAQFIASLHHPNIVQVHDFQIITEQDSDTKAYMVMDYIEGGTLADYIRHTSRKGLFPPATDFVQLLTGMSLAVDYAHQKGMIHRDIKPANILMDASTSSGSLIGDPILTDFGIAKLQDTNASTLTNALLGTPLYLSPEQARNQPITHRSDLYSLGIVLYELLTGITPFRGDSPMVIMMQHVYDMPTPPALINPAISPALSAVVMRSISKDPMARFPSAIAMAIAVAETFNLSISSIMEAGENTYFTPNNSVFTHQSPVQFSHIPTQYTQQHTYPTPPPQLASSSLRDLDGPTSISPSSSPARNETYATTPENVNTVMTPASPHNTPAYNQSAASLNSQQAPPVSPLPSTPSAPPTRTKRRNMFIVLTVGILILLVGVSVFSIYPLLRSHNGASATPTSTIGGVVGRIVFISSPNAPHVYDQLQIDLENIPPPSAGNVYYAWLDNVNDTGAYPKWEIQLSNGTLHQQYSVSQNTDLFAPYTLFLITEESTTSTPEVPQPTARMYYAIITHQSYSSPTFDVMQCPSNNGSNANNPCL